MAKADFRYLYVPNGTNHAIVLLGNMKHITLTSALLFFVFMVACVTKTNSIENVPKEEIQLIAAKNGNESCAEKKDAYISWLGDFFATPKKTKRIHSLLWIFFGMKGRDYKKRFR